MLEMKNYRDWLPGSVYVREDMSVSLEPGDTLDGPKSDIIVLTQIVISKTGNSS